MFRGVPQIPPFRAVRAPRLPDGGWFVYQDFCSRRSQRVSIEIKCSIEGLVSRETRVKPCRPQQVESDHGLRDQSIPKVHRETRIARRQACNQVRLERLYRAFGGVRSVQVWGNQRESDPLLFEVFDKPLRALVVQELYFGGETPCRKMRVERDLLRHQVFLRPIAKRLREDRVRVRVKKNEHVLVSKARCYGEPTRLVRVHFLFQVH